ncbi:ATP-dependent protease La (LON) domain protein [Bacteriovorax sp. Seq25_V]|nr:ATP-dependent protease La (LON) domain protein [Bacteriovorax sp. Seq25_V]
MIEKSLKEQTPIAVSLSREEESSDGRPIPSQICSIGMPIVLDRLEDGSLKVLLRGIGKARLIESKCNIPYQVYSAEIEFVNDAQTLLFDQIKFKYFKSLLYNWLEEAIKDPGEKEQFILSLNGPDTIIDYVCTFLIKDIATKQLLLEMKDKNEVLNLLSLIFEKENPFHENQLVTDAIRDFNSMNNFDNDRVAN